MDRRHDDRHKRRVTCEILLDGQRHHGIVLDLSPRGLFVQTEASPPPGSELQVTLRHGEQMIEVEARVARRRMVPRRLASVATGGIGLRLAQPSPEYAALVKNEREARPERRRTERRKRRGERLRGERRRQERRGAAAEGPPQPTVPPTRLAPDAAAPPPYRAAPAAAPAAATGPGRAGRRFRVRVQQSDGPRSRLLVVTARSEGEARTLALCDVGGGWCVLDVEAAG